METYTIGIDFGTLSARAVLVACRDGREISTASCNYKHAVMDQALPSGKALGVDWALQHPKDYMEAMVTVVRQVMQDAAVAAEDVVGIGTDFTACTMIPVLADGTPLCYLPEYEEEPHAYAKLWKHHAAEPEANKLNQIAEARGEEWLPLYGGKISSEWEIPKLWQILNEAPHIFAKMDYFVEGADWITWQLVGKQTRNSCTAGYKGTWNKRLGYPSRDFYAALDERLRDVQDTKISCPVEPIGQSAGQLTADMAAVLGLKEGTAVAMGLIDAHVALPAAGIASAGKVLGIMGTSTCHILLGDEEKLVPGMCGVVEDGVFPGYFGYEAGQSCVGDHFAWFVEKCVPEAYLQEAKQAEMDIQQYLTDKASQLQPGESGLLALDWWNGNRSVLVDFNLTGMMLGMTLATKPEEMYRALIEATAYGTKKIIEAFLEEGVPVEEFYATGGIAQKNAMAMQIYADVLNMPVKVTGANQGPALGAAIFGAAAAGREAGGYDDMYEATAAMSGEISRCYEPNPEAVQVYKKLYDEYVVLHDYFGRGNNNVMKRLKELRQAIKEQ